MKRYKWKALTEDENAELNNAIDAIREYCEEQRKNGTWLNMVQDEKRRQLQIMFINKDYSIEMLTPYQFGDDINETLNRWDEEIKTKEKDKIWQTK